MATSSDDDTALSLGDNTRESSIASMKENLPNHHPRIEADETKPLKPVATSPAMDQLSIRPYLEPPSDRLIRYLCQKALKDANSDQCVLKRSNIVSFTDVIAPAILQTMYDALGRLHSVLKRDHPDYSDRMKYVRKVFLKTAQDSCQNLRANPSLARQLLQRAVTVDPAELVRLKRNQNKHVWEEIAELMQAKVDLDKEHKKWETVRDSLRAKLELLQQQEREKQQDQNDTNMETEGDGGEIPAEVSEEDQLLEKIHDVVTWMRTSAVRLVDGLPDASKLVALTEERRAELYKSYRESQQISSSGKLELLSQAFSTQDDDSMDSL